MKQALMIGAIVLLVQSQLISQTAFIQVLHNAADPAAAVVDVYVNGELALNDFAFRTATPFIEVPINLTVHLAPPTSSSIQEAIFTKDFTLEPNNTYIVVANGVLQPDQFTSAGDETAAPIAFDLYPLSNARRQAQEEGEVDIRVFHGATDAPAVQVASGGVIIVPSLSYGAGTDYLSVSPLSYTLDVAPVGGDVLASYIADVRELGGAALTIVASGFLNTQDNQNGPAFGLYAVSSEGGEFIALPLADADAKAYVQIIHNAADPIAESVDVYINGERAIDNFAFRTATPFLEVPSGVTIEVGVAPANSESAADILATFELNVEPGRYLAIANGVLFAQDFAPNPDSRSPAITFSVYPIGGIQESADDGMVNILVFHGATDAPSVDVYANGTLKLISDLYYSKVAEYVSVPAGNYTIGVAPAGGNIIAEFSAPLTELAGQSVAVLASGFLNPTVNKNGPAFGLWAATQSGGSLIELPPVVTSVGEVVGAFDPAMVTPNPASTTLKISAQTEVQPGTVTISTLTGELVYQRNLTVNDTHENSIVCDVSDFVPGQYIVRVTSNNHVRSTLVAIVR